MFTHLPQVVAAVSGACAATPGLLLPGERVREAFFLPVNASPDVSQPIVGKAGLWKDGARTNTTTRD
jgi:hypothetical protein